MAVTICANILMYFLNTGLMVGLVFGVLIVLRPVTGRLLTPGQRVVLWGTGWMMSLTPQLISLLSYLPIPFPTLRSLTVSRTEVGGMYSIPSFLPYFQEEGTYHLALPGDLAVPVQISQGTLNVLAAVLVVYLVISFAMAMVGDIWTVRRARSGEELDGKTLGVEVDNDTVIRLCAHLPTSFVIRRRWAAGLSVLLTAFLLLFLYTMPRASQSQREAAWSQYISSGELRQEIEGRIPVMYRDDMEKLWTKGPGELVARGSSGQWYICHLRWGEEEGYQFGSVGLFYPEEGQLEKYSPVP